MKYRYPRTRFPDRTDGLVAILHTSSLLKGFPVHSQLIIALIEFSVEEGFDFWRTPDEGNERMPYKSLEQVPAFRYEPALPTPLSDFTVVMHHASGETHAAGHHRWPDKRLEAVFGAKPGEARFVSLLEGLLAIEGCEAANGDLFVTLDEDLLACRDSIQNRAQVFIVSPAEALDYIDVFLKRRGVYALRACSHIKGLHGYYFQRMCELIPTFPLAWSCAVHGVDELQQGKDVLQYLQSFHLRVLTLLEIKDRIADQYYRIANNDTEYLMMRELNSFMPLVTGTLDALAWLCRYLYQYGLEVREDDPKYRKFRHRITLRLQDTKSTGTKPAKNLIDHIKSKNEPLGILLNSEKTQALFQVFYPVRDSIQHRHPLSGIHWATEPTEPAQSQTAFSLGVLDSGMAQAIELLDKPDASDYFTDWGIRYTRNGQLLEPCKFVRKALEIVCKFYGDFFAKLNIDCRPELSAETITLVCETADDRTKDSSHMELAIPFFLHAQNPPVALSPASEMSLGQQLLHQRFQATRSP